MGDTVAVIRAHIDSPILCIEGHPGFAELLRCNAATLGGVAIERAIVGAVAIHVARGVARPSRYRRGRGGRPPDRRRHLARCARASPRLRRGEAAQIDTDGWDLEILAGAREWIERVRPVLFFEWDPALAMATADRLAFDPGPTWATSDTSS